MTTFKFRQHLPSIPIPDLEEIRWKPLEAIEPLVSDKEFKETKKSFNSFLK